MSCSTASLLSGADDALPALAEVRALELEREGIAMFVAVHDLRPGRVVTVGDARAQDEGERLAVLFDGYWQGLQDAGFPPLDDEPDETGARELIDVLVVLSDRHLSLRSIGADGGR
jgi:hypothetical protein